MNMTLSDPNVLASTCSGVARAPQGLDSIRNSCDVFFLSHLLKLLHNTLGQPHMTAADLAVWVNDKLELVEEDHYSARTMVSWLHLCGFKVSTEYRSFSMANLCIKTPSSAS